MSFICHGLLACALGVLAACAHQPPGPLPPPVSSPLLHQPLPRFQRATLQGPSFDSAEAAGRCAVIDFFADYCRPCHELLPALRELHHRLPDVVMAAVSIDADADLAQRVARRHRLDFPVIWDSNSVLAGRFRVTMLPATFVVARDGVVRWVGAAAHRADTLQAVVEATCEGPKVEEKVGERTSEK